MYVPLQVTHLGYYDTEEEAARVYDRVALSLHGPSAQTNFPGSDYANENVGMYSGLSREELQRALGVQPMDKSSRQAALSVHTSLLLCSETYTCLLFSQATKWSVDLICSACCNQTRASCFMVACLCWVPLTYL